MRCGRGLPLPFLKILLQCSDKCFIMKLYFRSAEKRKRKYIFAFFLLFFVIWEGDDVFI